MGGVLLVSKRCGTIGATQIQHNSGLFQIYIYLFIYFYIKSVVLGSFTKSSMEVINYQIKT